MKTTEPGEPVVRCEACRRVLHDPVSRARRIGPVCLLRLPGGRLGHVPAEIAEGQEVLFPAQPVLFPVPPGLPVEGETPTPTSNEET